MSEIESQLPLEHQDLLTGVGNWRSLSLWLMDRQSHDHGPPFTLIALDVNGFREVNHRYGHVAGDEALRWIAQVIEEETAAPVYRIGGDEFVAVMEMGELEPISEIAEQLFAHLNREADKIALQPPVAEVAVISFEEGNKYTSGDVIGEVYTAISELKANPEQSVLAFHAGSIQPNQGLQRAIKNLSIQLEQLGKRLDESHLLAHTDSLTGLPNARAAMYQLDLALGKSEAAGTSFAVLLIDGDDLRQYNASGYSAGDDMIQELATVQQEQIRSQDFLARWRMGDEFLLIMPTTDAEKALAVGERIRSAVERESHAWDLPVTISGGLAVYPEHGDSLGELLDKAEKAKDKAKQMGKNRIELAD